MGEVNQLDMDYLVSNSASHSNFKWTLERASEETIRGALQEIGDNHRKAAVVKALNGQLIKLLEAQSEQVTATETRQTRAVTMDMTTLQAERDQQQAEREEQADREKRIAEAHEVAGRIQALTFVEKVVTVTTLMQLRGIKESKAYRDIPLIGTWEKYCDYLSLDRHTVDERLRQLETFGAQFLETCHQFSISHRDLRKLRQLSYDGESFQMSDDGKTVVIEGEAISLGEDAGAEIEAALEKLLEKNKTLRERNGKLEKDLRGAVKEEMTTFTAEKKALVERVKELEKYEPQQLDETKYEAQYAEIHNLMSKLGGCIKAVMALDDLQDHPGAMARVDGYVEGCNYLANELRELWADQCMFKNE